MLVAAIRVAVGTAAQENNRDYRMQNIIIIIIIIRIIKFFNVA